jgi:hypothetical protein
LGILFTRKKIVDVFLMDIFAREITFRQGKLPESDQRKATKD